LAEAIGSIHAAEWAVEATMLRILITLAALLALTACIPNDPNLDKLVKGETDLLKEDNAHAELMSDKRAEAIAKCAAAPNVDGCMLGAVALELAANSGNRSQTKRTMPAYTPPQTALQQIGGFVRDVTPLGNGLANAFVALDGTREREQTARHNEAVNAARELGTVQAVAGLGATIAQQPPRIHVGGNYGDTDNSTHGPIDSYNEDNDQDNDVEQSGDGSAFGDDNIVNNGEFRDESPGPIDNSDDGDDCSGESCNPTAPPAEEAP
jgi:hypothetical protein